MLISNYIRWIVVGKIEQCLVTSSHILSGQPIPTRSLQLIHWRNSSVSRDKSMNVSFSIVGNDWKESVLALHNEVILTYHLIS